MDDLLKNAAQALNGDRFKLILFPTERCNFRCLYCYEDHAGVHMSHTIVDSIKKFITQKIPRIKLFELEWFGGEPTLAKDIVTDITLLAQQMCNDYGVKFVATMTTNGYLLDFETFENFVQLGISSYQITFDGDKENHDKFRILANKDVGTFDEIWNNLCETKKSEKQFSIAIRCHLTAINSDSIRSLLTKIYDKFGDDDRYYVHLKEVSALGGKHDDQMCLLSNEEKDVLKKRIQGEFPFLQFVDIGKDYICYAAKPNTFAIRANGTIAKCTVALDCELNNVGKILTDGTLDIDSNKFLLWSQGFNDLDKIKLDCPYYHIIRKNDN